MWDLIVSVPDHCLTFYFEISDIETKDIIQQQRRWSDSADAQADMRLCCSHMA